jgi:hypothetical protein
MQPRVSVLLADSSVGRRAEFIVDDGGEKVAVMHWVSRAQIEALDPSTIREVPPRRYQRPSRPSRGKGGAAARKVKR